MRTAFVGIAVLAALADCGANAEECPSSDGEFVAVVSNDAWAELPAQDDPLTDHQPETIECGLGGWFEENGSLEIDTNACNYASLHQPALVAIDECRMVRLTLYHFDLTAAEPAQAHVAILVDGQVLWEREIDVPGPGAVYEEAFASPISAPVGADVVLHLHNHGQNTWTFVGLEVD